MVILNLAFRRWLGNGRGESRGRGKKFHWKHFQCTSTIVSPTKAFSNFSTHNLQTSQFHATTDCLLITTCSRERNADLQTPIPNSMWIFTVEEVQASGEPGSVESSKGLSEDKKVRDLSAGGGYAAWLESCHIVERTS